MLKNINLGIVAKKINSFLMRWISYHFFMPAMILLILPFMIIITNDFGGQILAPLFRLFLLLDPSLWDGSGHIDITLIIVMINRASFILAIANGLVENIAKRFGRSLRLPFTKKLIFSIGFITFIYLFSGIIIIFGGDKTAGIRNLNQLFIMGIFYILASTSTLLYLVFSRFADFIDQKT